MNSVKIVSSVLLLATVMLLWSLAHRKLPSYHYANDTWTAKLVSKKATVTPAVGGGDYNINIENNGPLKMSNHYVHGCYNKGPIRTVERLLEENTLKSLGCMRRSPQVVIFGVRKSGTTALRDFLSFHPQLAVTDTEIHYLEFLSRNINGRTSYATEFQYGETGNSIRITGGKEYRNRFQPMERLKNYTSLMPYSTPKQLVVEKTPKYFVCKDCPILLHKMIPDCKLIAIFGEPVKRAISDYLHVLEAFGHVTNSYLRRLGMKETFEKTVTHEDGSVKSKSPFIEIGIYKKYLQRWFSVFPRENILILDGVEFKNNPEKVLQQVEIFLGINSFFTSETFEFNKTKGFYCLKSPINTCMPKSKGRKYPYVAPVVIKKLQQFYEPYNVEFSKFVNQTFSWVKYT